MKKSTTTAVLLSGAILAFQSAFAQSTFVQNDLYMGFQNSAGGGTADYIINLGAASNIVGQSTVVDLSSSFSSSLFHNGSLQGASAQIVSGVVGASNGQNPSDVYGTQLRTGNIGNPAVAGSSNPNTLGLTTAQDTTVAQNLSLLVTPSAGAGVLDSTKSWESSVEPALTAGSYYGSAGFNPDAAVTTNTVLYEDLWFTGDNATRGSKPFVYVGYFSLDLTGANPRLTFTSTNVPPSLSRPMIASIKKVGTAVTVVSSNAVATFNYQLQYTTSLHPTNWVNVGSAVIAAGAMVTNTDATATDAQRFYRVQGH